MQLIDSVGGVQIQVTRPVSASEAGFHVEPGVHHFDGSDVYRAVIQPPYVAFNGEPDPRGSILIPDIEAIRALASRLFTPPGERPQVELDIGSASTP